MKIDLKIENVDDGYESRCSVCNSEFREEIEAMRENNKTFEEIRNFSLIQGTEISLMGLSRHFSKHYPQRKLYLRHIESKQTKIEREVGFKITEIFNLHPNMDRNYFEDTCTFSRKNREGTLEYMEKCNKEIFMDDYGFCHACAQLCPLIPAKESFYQEELEKYYIDKKIKGSKLIKLECIQCRMRFQEHMISMLASIVSRLILNSESE